MRIAVAEADKAFEAAQNARRAADLAQAARNSADIAAAITQPFLRDARYLLGASKGSPQSLEGRFEPFA